MPVKLNIMSFLLTVQQKIMFIIGFFVKNTVILVTNVIKIVS